LKVENNLKDYLSFHMIKDKELSQIMILHPHLINNMQDKLVNEVLENRTYRTPATPRFQVNCPDQDSELIDLESQSRYCSGDSMLLYLTKYSRPDICYVVRY
jgi:hypothetical protein